MYPALLQFVKNDLSGEQLDRGRRPHGFVGVLFIKDRAAFEVFQQRKGRGALNAFSSAGCKYVRDARS